MPDYSLDQSSFMLTYSGIEFTMFDPKPEQVLIEDIAHALSMLCRFTGHTTEFYSVAQHSVLVSWQLPRELQLEGLLHDAAEAYINDLSRPIKHHPGMEAYQNLETGIERVVRQKFGLPTEMTPLVKHYDNLLVVDEARRFWRRQPEWTQGQTGVGLSIQPWPPHEAKRAFLAQFDTCMRQRTQQ